MSKLIICEKPSVAEDFFKALSGTKKHKGYFECNHEGSIYYITYCFGHLFEFVYKDSKEWNLNDLPIFPNNWFPSPISSKKEQIKIICNLINISSDIIIATDAGREGELIARELLEYSDKNIYSKKNVFRFFTSEALTKDVILKGLKQFSIYTKYNYLYFQAKGRMMSDWLVGINLTRGYTLVNNSGLISIGRVQTPILFEISKRTNEYKSFQPTSSFNLSFQGDNNILLKSSISSPNEKEIQIIVSNLSPYLPLYITKFEESNEKNISAPPLHSLTTLQQEANIKFGLSPKKTLDIAQKLYEEYKLISYPRSDSQYLADSSVSYFSECLTRVGFPNYANEVSLDRFSKIIFDSSKLTDHHAIICIDSPKNISLLPDELNVFNLILNRMTNFFKGDYKYKTILIEGNVSDTVFSNTFTKVIDYGWKAFLNENEHSFNDDDASSDLSNTLSSSISINVGDSISGKLFAREVKSTPPKLYTEASILKFMDKNNLGTPATRADIIEKLFNRDYIFLEKKKLFSTPKGDSLVSVLLENNSLLLNIDFTSKVEKELNSINSQNELYSFESKIKDIVFSELSNVNKSSNKIQRSLSKKQIEFFNKLCKQYKVNIDINNVDPDNFDKTIKEILETNKITCKCGSLVNETPKTFFCPNCNLTVFKTISGKNLTFNQVKDLFLGKEIVCKNLKSKTGKVFDAKLVVKDNRVSFIF